MRMKKKALRKEFYMEVRRTWNRFLSLLLITALGVAFFSGIRAAQPDMELSADRYYQETQLMDVFPFDANRIPDEAKSGEQLIAEQKQQAESKA